ncbi:MAG: MBOAT family protein [Solobacterium sp.]|jgi:D-alanyl-lipoteichoic acid acyltransferase DltB (MBOAT superfamily)|nr:MBOAT family protein [Solobacterium sp.]MCH4049758.1 MBOAT family protein [Solobacterium sp.]MCH4073443.1 MBOAT family protein [Solobacterium sp.]MCI1313417.1 MBOAT family protein [Solobacterium sp.]MCI1345679.1 MBOAT family protein [Solobacterium sp.]
MAYTDMQYLGLFLPLTMLVYQITPKQYRQLVLLGFSLLFFWLCSHWLLLFALAAVMAAYFGGRAVESSPKGMVRNFFFFAALAAIIGILAVFKYTNFAITVIDRVFSQSIPFVTIIAPIGISYYSLEAIGYLLEVKWERIPAEKNLIRLALFLTFFPQIMEGPIARYQDTADQLVKGESINMGGLNEGLLRIFYGMFKKLVIADRLAPIVKYLYGNADSLHGVLVAAAAVSYTMQLYMDFSGEIDIVIGSARIFNIALPENFRQPFFSQSASEFWRRWHISLGTWLKTYIFYPISTTPKMAEWVNFSRRHFGRYLTKLSVMAMALFPVWMLNGLWHGGRFNYLMYGMYYFVILMIGIALEPVKKGFYRKTHFNKNGVFFKGFRMVLTWIIVFTGEMLFNSPSVGTWLLLCRHLFAGRAFFHVGTLTLSAMSTDSADLLAAVVGTVLVLSVDDYQEKHGSVIKKIRTMRLPVRWALYYALVFAIIIFGAYGTGYQAVDPIYAGF